MPKSRWHAKSERNAVRAVIDTNILVSALLTPGGISAQLIAAIRSRSLTPVVSEMILAEYIKKHESAVADFVPNGFFVIHATCFYVLPILFSFAIFLAPMQGLPMRTLDLATV